MGKRPITFSERYRNVYKQESDSISHETGELSRLLNSKIDDQCFELLSTDIPSPSTENAYIYPECPPAATERHEEYKKVGRFTSNERTILLNALNRHFESQNWSWDEGTRIMFPGVWEDRSKSSAIVNGVDPKEKPPNWSGIYTCLPRRSYRSIYYYARRNFLPWKKGPWSKQEEITLISLVNTQTKAGQRPRWNRLAYEFKREPLSIKDKWRELYPMLLLLKAKNQDSDAVNNAFIAQVNSRNVVASNSSTVEEVNTMKDSCLRTDDVSEHPSYIENLLEKDKEIRRSAYARNRIYERDWRTCFRRIEDRRNELVETIRCVTGLYAPCHNIPWKEVQTKFDEHVSESALRRYYMRHLYPSICSTSFITSNKGDNTMNFDEDAKPDLNKIAFAIPMDGMGVIDPDNVNESFATSSTLDSDLCSTRTNTFPCIAVEGSDDKTQDFQSNILIQNATNECSEYDADGHKLNVELPEVVDLPNLRVLSRQVTRYLHTLLIDRSLPVKSLADLDIGKALPFYIHTKLLERLQTNLRIHIPSSLKSSSLDKKIKYLYEFLDCDKKKRKDLLKLTILYRTLKMVNGQRMTESGIAVPISSCKGRHRNNDRTLNVI